MRLFYLHSKARDSVILRVVQDLLETFILLEEVQNTFESDFKDPVLDNSFGPAQGFLDFKIKLHARHQLIGLGQQG